MTRTGWLCVGVSAVTGVAAFYRLPFPEEDALLQLTRLAKPHLFYGLKAAYLTMLFATPYIAVSVLCSLAYIFAGRPARSASAPKLPVYPDPAGRDTPYLVVG